jgi:hypothetical protein
VHAEEGQTYGQRLVFCLAATGASHRTTGFAPAGVLQPGPDNPRIGFFRPLALAAARLSWGLIFKLRAFPRACAFQGPRSLQKHHPANSSSWQGPIPLELGFRDITVIDEDLGRSGSGLRLKDLNLRPLGYECADNRQLKEHQGTSGNSKRLR